MEQLVEKNEFKVEEVFLQSPFSKKALRNKGKSLVCDKEYYPKVHGIPCIVKNPQGFLAQWKSKLDGYIQKLSHEIEDLEKKSVGQDINPSTFLRFEILKTAKRGQKNHIMQIFKDVSIQSLYPDGWHDAMGTPPLEQVPFMGYYANLFRDWTWGAEENQKHFQVIDELVGMRNLGNVLVIGAGGCRLAYDIHVKLKPRSTTVMDINPFLLMVAKKVIEGDDVRLFEFPKVPRSNKRVAIENRLKAPLPVKSNFHFVLSDFFQNPFAENYFDCIVTPWFIDVLNEDIKLTVNRINTILRPGGIWLNFGALATYHRGVESQYTREEVKEIVDHSGFTLESQIVKDLPYMQSPFECQQRFENIWSFLAVKDVSMIPMDVKRKNEWLTETNQPIPMREEYKTQKFTSRLEYEILTAVNGKRSIDEIAVAISQKYALSLSEAKASLCCFFDRYLKD